MKWPARVLLVLELLTAPSYFILDTLDLLPLAWRDRPWPLALLGVVMPWVVLWRMPRVRFASTVLAVISVGVLGWTAHSRYRLPPTSADARTGAPLPDVSLQDESGNVVRLGDLAGRPTLFIWFRGSWCPYCRRQLAEVSSELRRFSGAPIRVLALAPDPPEPLKKLRTDLQLPFPLLADPQQKVANHCRLSHCVAILDSAGIVRWEVLSGNWEKDLPARALLQAAYRQK